MSRKFWFAMTGPSGTGKTTLMYETVACLREAGIEAVGSTEGVRLTRELNHETLSKDSQLHTDLFVSQLVMERTLSDRFETEVIVLDRCLLDYYVLAVQTFPEMEETFKNIIDQQIKISGFGTLESYLNRFLRVYVPNLLPLSEIEKKGRPDNDFREVSSVLFNMMEEKFPTLKSSGQIWREPNNFPLKSRCQRVFIDMIDKMGRSDIFFDWYSLADISTLVRDLVNEVVDKSIVTDVYVSGSRSGLSPSLPSYRSDYDFFVEMDGSITKRQHKDLQAGARLISRMIGTKVAITVISSRMAGIMKMKRRV